MAVLWSIINNPSSAVNLRGMGIKYMLVPLPPIERERQYCDKAMQLKNSHGLVTQDLAILEYVLIRRF